jgi:hypothetical protein
MNVTKAYSPGSNSPKRFAPASTQSPASPLILWSNTKVGVCLLRKTLDLRSFQISQTVSKVNKAKALRCVDGLSTKSAHQSLMARPAHYLGCTLSIPHYSFKSS